MTTGEAAMFRTIARREPGHQADAPGGRSPSGQAPPAARTLYPARTPARTRTRERGAPGRVALVSTGRTVDGSPVWAPFDLAGPGE
jgi:hypothetical protein